VIVSGQVSGDQAVIVALNNLYDRVHDALRNAIRDDILKLQGHIVADKLSGQVLKRRTGALAASVQPGPVIEEGETITGTIGTNVPYARILEYGGVIQHPGGTAYLILANGQAEFVSNATADNLPGLPRTKPHAIPIPEHSYMRSGLADLRDEIVKDLQSAAINAARWGQ
jgi:phage gpG-like protein